MTNKFHYFISIISLLVLTTLTLPVIVTADNPVPIPTEAPESKKTIYRLLAPIPGLTCIDDVGSDKDCVKGGIGEYLNIIFKIGIGLCGVLAVVMLVINFIGYMSSESFTEKARFKEKFWGPIGGLLLALGAYAILTTINPSLTGKDGLTVDEVGVVVEPEVTNEYTPQEAMTIIQSYRNNTGSFSTPNPGPTSIPNDSPGLLKIISGGGWGGVPRNLVVNQVSPIIEKDGLRQIKAIIMHGTAGGSGNANVLASWIANNSDGANKKNDTGAHFVIDKDGTIWQTIRLNKRANHFIPNTKGNGLGISSYNTIGIEIVQKYICEDGTYNKCKKWHWESVSNSQVSSAKILLSNLLSKNVLNLTSSDIYGHGEIGIDRTPDEGLEALRRSGYR